jgi:hypothetical protein
MNLENWSKNGWLRPYRTSPSQIAELFSIADRGLEDARTDRLSTDWRQSANFSQCFRDKSRFKRAKS